MSLPSRKTPKFGEVSYVKISAGAAFKRGSSVKCKRGRTLPVEVLEKQFGHTDKDGVRRCYGVNLKKIAIIHTKRNFAVVRGDDSDFLRNCMTLDRLRGLFLSCSK
ncbi:hypothetical protein Y032_0190g1239 [Ancylostoma ceylanicum]|uniref:Uncharacterized protein n=1 Tax=Ancylostoma ceylanicum TaxID=53326 RepID=A0A016SQ57_9BILA|nr:hypothetical protein Y032_0190g1239 [Ancylostoma ceylanicum]